jgi:hypothetical protein
MEQMTCHATMIAAAHLRVFAMAISTSGRSRHTPSLLLVVTIYITRNGACVTLLNPYNSPACRLPAYAQPYGCVDTTINQTTCESQTGAVWRKKARTEGECNAFGYGCTERRIVANWNNRYYITRKDPDACAAVGGAYGPILTWRAVRTSARKTFR